MFVIDKKERMMTLAVGFAMLGGLLAWIFLRHLENTFQEGSETVSILVANRYIVPGTPLLPQFFSPTPVPKVYVQPTAVAAFSVLESSPGHPRFRNNIALLEGTQLSQTALSPLYLEDGLSQIIPENHVAVSFGVDSVRGLSGNVRPGDIINILHTPKTAVMAPANTVTTTLFQAVHVVAVDKKLALPERPSSDKDKTKDTQAENPQEQAVVLTVYLNPLAALRLVQARESEVLSVVLRPQGDDRIVESLP